MVLHFAARRMCPIGVQIYVVVVDSSKLNLFQCPEAARDRAACSFVPRITSRTRTLVTSLISDAPYHAGG